VTGQPHSRNLDRWQSLVGLGDVLGLHRVLTGLDRDSIEMREVSPMSGLLPQDDQNFVAALVGSALTDRATILARLPAVDERYRGAAELAASWLRSRKAGN
jgi:hypothetical protein